MSLLTQYPLKALKVPILFEAIKKTAARFSGPLTAEFKKDMSAGGKLPNLDPLRGMLALLVVLAHVPGLSRSVGLPYYNDHPLFSKGYEAVWVFFTLSGFLIIRLLYLEKEKHHDVSVKRFYARRILRIYPVYYAVMIFAFLYYHYLLPAAGIPYDIEYNLFEGILYCVLFTPNVFRAFYNVGSILQILWSIGIEEQFYLIIAPISKYVKSNLFPVSLLLFTIVYFIVFNFEPSGYLVKFNLLFFYFSFGGLLSVLILNSRFQFLYFPVAVRLLLYLAFILYFTMGYAEISNRPLKHLISMVLFGLFVLNISKEDRLVVSNTWLIFLGKISYGIYMYHLIVLNFILFVFLKIRAYITMSDTLTVLSINIVTISLTILVAYLSYRFFETRFLDMKQDYRVLDKQRNRTKTHNTVIQ